jgi:hypothetical protein
VLQPYYELEIINPDRVIGRFSYSYASIVNRAPLLVRRAFLKSIGGWPTQYAPFNYDDIHLSLKAWQLGHGAIYMPIPGIQRDFGIGGTRLFGQMTPNKRPAHLGRNWGYIYREFGDFINSGELAAVVARYRSVM